MYTDYIYIHLNLRCIFVNILLLLPFTYSLCMNIQSFQKELGAHQRSVDSANASGQHLVSEVLDDPAVTQQDMAEMNQVWEGVCEKSVQKQERLNKAHQVQICTMLLYIYMYIVIWPWFRVYAWPCNQPITSMYSFTDTFLQRAIMYQCILNSCCVQAALAFEKGLSDMMEWIEVQRETLESMPPPDEDANELQRQIKENKVRMMYSFRQCNPSMHPKEVIKTGFLSLFEKETMGVL